MAFLIDTNIIIYSLKNNENVQKHFILNESLPKYISIITYGELLYGARRSQNIEKNLAVVYRIKELFPIVLIDLAVIETFSDLKVKYSKTGEVVDDFDLLIGATALTFNYILITNNEKHFSKITGLKVENWSKKYS